MEADIDFQMPIDNFLATATDFYTLLYTSTLFLSGGLSVVLSKGLPVGLSIGLSVGLSIGLSVGSDSPSSKDFEKNLKF